ncbi:hypothetical protein EVAR_22783_1 [Eumeta japonica]|uniref:Uncharacterized protein n=1 Tax=Eumeta variegata TaxID=151549 RepID=A0A4C1VHA2_EUMVA|nr:hypothetical protein EVAR_22783_1 [Eumeta japonica]
MLKFQSVYFVPRYTEVDFNLRKAVTAERVPYRPPGKWRHKYVVDRSTTGATGVGRRADDGRGVGVVGDLARAARAHPALDRSLVCLATRDRSPQSGYGPLMNYPK